MEMESSTTWMRQMTRGQNEKQRNKKREKERMKIGKEEAERGGECDEN